MSALAQARDRQLRVLLERAAHLDAAAWRTETHLLVVRGRVRHVDDLAPATALRRRADACCEYAFRILDRGAS